MRWIMVLIVVLFRSNAAASAEPASAKPASAEPASEAYQQGVSRLDEGDFDAAIKAFTEAIRLEPQLTDAYKRRGFAYGRKGEQEKAIADFSEAIRLAPDDAEAYRNRGVSHGMKGDHDKAIADFTVAIRLEPNAPTYCNRSTAYFNKNDLDKAIADCTEALRLKPDCAEAYFSRGLSYGKKGDLDKAIADLTAAIRLQPDALLYYNLGVAHKLNGESGKAVDDLVKAIRLDPKNPHPHNDLAWILATCPEERLRDGQRAVKHAARACDLTVWKQAGFTDTLAAAYAEVGDFGKAVEFEQKALELATDDEKKDEFRGRLRLYREGKPHRDTPER
jgi:tetratricopeptide (TPR) repeat protein